MTTIKERRHADQVDAKCSTFRGRRVEMPALVSRKHGGCNCIHTYGTRTDLRKNVICIMTTTPRPLKLIQAAASGPALPVKAFSGDPTYALDWSKEPAGLALAGLEEWRRLGEVYGNDASRFTEGDRATVYAFCSIWADFLTAEEILNREGLTQPGRSSADQARGGMVKHPALQAKREASQQLRYLATALKLTPAARSAGDQSTDDQDNPFA